MVLSLLTSESELSTDKTNNNDKRKVGHILIDIRAKRNIDVICFQDIQFYPYLY